MTRKEIEELCTFDIATMSEEERDDRYEVLKDVLKDVNDELESDNLSRAKEEFLDEMYGLITEAMSIIKVD